MNIEVITPPEIEPVTPLEAFIQLKLTADASPASATAIRSDPQYAEVVRQITSAREQCEQITRRAFMKQTLRLTRGPARRGEFQARGHEGWCRLGGRPWPRLELLRPPLMSLDQVQYYDDANTLQTLAPSAYFIVGGLVPVIQLVADMEPPSLYLREDAIQLTYTVGYPETDDNAEFVPASIKGAVLIGVQLESDRLDPRERDAYVKAQASLLSSFRVSTY